MSEADEWAVRLERDGFLLRTPDGRLCTTRQWHGALARAASRLYSEGHELADLRTPIAAVLVECYSDELDSSLAVAVSTMLPIAMRELAVTVP